VLSLLHQSYHIGSGLKAPQATLFASLAGGLFGKGSIPVGMIGLGIGIGMALIAADAWLKARGARFRLHPMPVAVGMYLPFTLSVPILLGGLIRSAGQRALARKAGARGAPGASESGGRGDGRPSAAEDGAQGGAEGKAETAAQGDDAAAGKAEAAAEDELANAGVLLSSGLIAGESILGVALAACVYFKVPLAVAWHPAWLAWASLALFLALAGYLAKAARTTLR
jgi:uncharacterized oligopeptide transporter (OPT) family protein